MNINSEYVTNMWDLASNGEAEGVWFFISVYAFFIVGYSFVYQLKMRKWPITKGHLLDAKIKKFGHTNELSEQDYKVSAEYSYSVDGKEYKGHRVSPWIIIASHNAQFILANQLEKIYNFDDGYVKVYYNPNKPEKSYLIKPSITGIVVTMFIAVGPIILHWFVY